MIVHRADAILPIAGPPLRQAWVAIDGGRIVARGSTEPPPEGEPGGPPFAGEPFVILPALVNAHTHLELSYLHDAVPPCEQFDAWVRRLVAERRGYRGARSTIEAEARRAIRQARASGTGLIGDIGNTLMTLPLFGEANVSARVFYELLGFNVPDPDSLVRRAREDLDGCGNLSADVRAGLAPHAPYSVSPALFRAIQRDLDCRAETISSVHLAESREEVEFLMRGRGAIRDALEELGAWNPDWDTPGCGPLEYIARHGLLHPGLLVVHAVQLTDEELRRVKAAGATIVTCPRSNRWTGAGSPPLQRFYASGVPIAFGTDSLASVEDLNVFSELALARALAPDVPARRFLESATEIGAAALGFGDELGTIESGKRARLIAVRIPAHTVDVEEYLLTGIQPADVRWLASWGAGEHGSRASGLNT